MPSRFSRMLLVVCALLWSSFVLAAPPSTITYQGTLGSASGAPLTTTLEVTFRFYDSATGGMPLWFETQSVNVSAGRFSVELGSITSLPEELFANPAFLALEVTGDVEMTPRLKMSSAPSALRARALLRNTLHVSSDSTPQINADALRQALSVAALSAAADNKVVVAVDAGEFALGAATLVIPSFVELVGAGPSSTLLTSTAVANALQLSSDSSLRSLGVLNEGVGGDFSNPTSAIGMTDIAARVSITDVSASSMPPVGVQGTDVRTGLYFRQAADLVVSDSDFHAARSSTLYALRASGITGPTSVAGTTTFRQVRASVSEASVNARGLDSFGRMSIVVDGMDIQMRSGGLPATNVLGFRTQADVSVMARGLDTTMAYADVAIEEARGFQFSRSARVDLVAFQLRVDTGTCSPAGFRNAVVFFNDDGVGSSIQVQNAPQMRDGVIEVSALDCFAGGIFSAGSKPQIDNVRVQATLDGLSTDDQAVAYVQRASSNLCDGAVVQAGTASIRNSTLLATAEAGGGYAAGIETCVDGLDVERSTVSGSNRGFTALNNSTGTFRFDIRHSRLLSTLWEPLFSNSDATGSVRHTSLEAVSGSDILAFADPESGLRGVIGCAFVDSSNAIAAGPICPCSAGADCPVAP